MLANELHRRLTFRADGRVSWFAAQWEGGGIALVGILATALALGWLGRRRRRDGTRGSGCWWSASSPAPSGWCRFVALRWIFAPRAERNA